MEFKDKLEEVMAEIKHMLINKNRKYGNSALEPVRIFSKASPTEQILVRLDDKLSRMRNQQHDEDEDVVDDLLGYLILLKIAEKDIDEQYPINSEDVSDIVSGMLEGTGWSLVSIVMNGSFVIMHNQTRDTIDFDTFTTFENWYKENGYDIKVYPTGDATEEENKRIRDRLFGEKNAWFIGRTNHAGIVVGYRPTGSVEATSEEFATYEALLEWLDYRNA